MFDNKSIHEYTANEYTATRKWYPENTRYIQTIDFQLLSNEDVILYNKTRIRLLLEVSLFLNALCHLSPCILGHCSAPAGLVAVAGQSKITRTWDLQTGKWAFAVNISVAGIYGNMVMYRSITTSLKKDRYLFVEEATLPRRMQPPL